MRLSTNCCFGKIRTFSLLLQRELDCQLSHEALKLQNSYVVDLTLSKMHHSFVQGKCVTFTLQAHKNQFHSPELFASKRLDDQSLNQSACPLQRSCSPCPALESNHQQTAESYRRSRCHCTETNCYCGHFELGVAFAIF